MRGGAKEMVSNGESCHYKNDFLREKRKDFLKKKLRKLFILFKNKQNIKICMLTSIILFFV